MLPTGQALRVRHISCYQEPRKCRGVRVVMQSRLNGIPCKLTGQVHISYLMLGVFQDDSQRPFLELWKRMVDSIPVDSSS